MLFSPITAGVSLVSLGASAPRILNALKKREIIEAGLEAKGSTHHTRKRDVIAPMAISGAVGGLTLGFGTSGVETMVINAAGRFAGEAVTHVSIEEVPDTPGVAAEHPHDQTKADAAITKLRTHFGHIKIHYGDDHHKIQTPHSPLLAESPVLLTSQTPVQVVQAEPQVLAQAEKHDCVSVTEIHVDETPSQPESQPQLPHRPAAQSHTKHKPVPQHQTQQSAMPHFTLPSPELVASVEKLLDKAGSLVITTALDDGIDCDV